MLITYAGPWAPTRISASQIPARWTRSSPIRTSAAMPSPRVLSTYQHFSYDKDEAVAEAAANEAN